MINRDNPIWAFMAKTLKNNDWIQDLFNKTLVVLNRRKFLSEVERRSKISFYNYEELAAPLPFCPFERTADTNFYGHASALKIYAGVSKQNYSFEHGLYFDDYIPPATYLRSVKRVITINKEREQLISKKVGKPVHAVGPYIHYAESLLSNSQINEIKSKYGRILLVFPSHSCVELGSCYDENRFIESINKFKVEHGFDSVFVSLFYHDILHNDYAKAYRNAGFKIVTSGHRYDLNFIRRQKSLFELCDYTIGNSVGTHIGYSIYMGKPHCIICDPTIEDSQSKQYRTIGKVFSEYTDSVTSEQHKIASRYWGFDCVKSREELSIILSK